MGGVANPRWVWYATLMRVIDKDVAGVVCLAKCPGEPIVTGTLATGVTYPVGVAPVPGRTVGGLPSITWNAGC